MGKGPPEVARQGDKFLRVEVQLAVVYVWIRQNVESILNHDLAGLVNGRTRTQVRELMLGRTLLSQRL